MAQNSYSTEQWRTAASLLYLLLNLFIIVLFYNLRYLRDAITSIKTNPYSGKKMQKKCNVKVENNKKYQKSCLLFDFFNLKQQSNILWLFRSLKAWE